MTQKLYASGFTEPFLSVFPGPVIAKRSPTSKDVNYQVGQVWIDSTLSAAFICTAKGVWDQVGAQTSGSATLALGTVTIADTSITATDKVIVSHGDPNASTGIGTLTVVVTAGTGFVVTSLAAAGTTETGDLSDVYYTVIRG